MSFWKSRKN